MSAEVREWIEPRRPSALIPMEEMLRMRTINDDHGRPWEAVAIPTKVAHLRDGAQLGFRLSGDANAVVTAPITFNSLDAANFAISTMGEKELRRRLELAKTAAGVA